MSYIWNVTAIFSQWHMWNVYSGPYCMLDASDFICGMYLYTSPTYACQVFEMYAYLLAYLPIKCEAEVAVGCVWYMCHRHGNWVKEKMEKFRCIYSIWGSSMDARRCADKWQCFWCTFTVVFLLEDQSRWLWHHEMMSQGSLILLREGTIKGEHNQTSGLSSGSSDTEHLGLLTSHRPSTLAVSVPLVEQSITRMDCVICLSICMYPDLLGNF